MQIQLILNIELPLLFKG